MICILKKMAYYLEGGSEKHLRDIAGVIRVQETKIDLAYIEGWAEKLGLTAIWQEILERTKEGDTSETKEAQS